MFKKINVALLLLLGWATAYAGGMAPASETGTDPVWHSVVPNNPKKEARLTTSYYVKYLESQGQWDPLKILCSDIDSVSPEQYGKAKYNRFVRNVTGDIYGLAWLFGSPRGEYIAKKYGITIPDNVGAEEVIYFYKNYGKDGYKTWANARAADGIYDMQTSGIGDAGDLYFYDRAPYGAAEGEFGMFLFDFFEKSWHCGNVMRDYTVILDDEVYEKAAEEAEEIPCPKEENQTTSPEQTQQSGGCNCCSDPVVVNNYYGSSQQSFCGPTYGWFEVSWSWGWSYQPTPQPLWIPVYYDVINYETVVETVTETVIEYDTVITYIDSTIFHDSTVIIYDTVPVEGDTIDDPNGDGDTIDDPNGDTDTIGDIPNRLANPDSLKRGLEKQVIDSTATNPGLIGENKKDTESISSPKTFGDLKATLDKLNDGNTTTDNPSPPEPKPDKPKKFGDLKAELEALQSASTEQVSTPVQSNVEIGIDKNVAGTDHSGNTADLTSATTTAGLSIKVVKNYTAPANAVEENTNTGGNTSSDAGVKGNGKTNPDVKNPVLESGSTTATFNTGGNQPSGSANDWSQYNMPSKSNVDMTATGSNTGQQNNQTGQVITTAQKSDLFLNQSSGSFETPSASFETNGASPFIDRGTKTNIAGNVSAGNGNIYQNSSSSSRPAIQGQKGNTPKPSYGNGGSSSSGPTTGTRVNNTEKRKGN